MTYLRIDLLYMTRELDAFYHARHPYSKYRALGESVFSDEVTWTKSPAEHVRLFTAPILSEAEREGAREGGTRTPPGRSAPVPPRA